MNTLHSIVALQCCHTFNQFGWMTGYIISGGSREQRERDGVGTSTTITTTHLETKRPRWKQVINDVCFGLYIIQELLMVLIELKTTITRNFWLICLGQVQIWHIWRRRWCMYRTLESLHITTLNGSYNSTSSSLLLHLLNLLQEDINLQSTQNYLWW